jgi:hypothetical protein
MVSFASGTGRIGLNYSGTCYIFCGFNNFSKSNAGQNMSFWEISSCVYFTVMIVFTLGLYVVAFTGGLFDLKKLFKDLRAKKQNQIERAETETYSENE